MKPTHAQLQNLRNIATFGGRLIAERFVMSLIRNGWVRKVGEYMDRDTSTFRLNVILTAAGEQLVESKKDCCSACACTRFVAFAVIQPPPPMSKLRCVCGHYQHWHDVTYSRVCMLCGTVDRNNPNCSACQNWQRLHGELRGV